VDASEKGAKAACDEEVHESETALVMHEGNFDFRTADGGAPRIFLNFIEGKRTNFGPSKKADGRAEEDSQSTAQNQNEGANVADWSTPELHFRPT
jgi:hypothetical protein